MLAQLTRACEALGDAIVAIDARLLTGVDCAQVVELLARTENRCAALRVVAAARAGECGAHRDRGFSSAAGWLAHTSGVTHGEAKAALDTSQRLDACPQTKEALVAGELSLSQAAEITKTEKAVPGSESDLLDLAGRSGVGGLRNEGRRLRLEAQNPEERYARQRLDRHLRHWQDDHGMIHVAGAFTPEVGVAVVNRIDAETDRLVRAADRGEGDSEPRERLAADALAKLVLEGGRPKSRSADVILVCDIEAFLRGHAHAGEVSHVIGAGPVPVVVARDVAKDAFIKAALHDGVRISTVAHFGRYLSAELRTALGLGEPPLFEGLVCAEEGCDRRYGLQFDHVDPRANLGLTSYENLQPLCRPCHKEKTRRDRETGLLGLRKQGTSKESGESP